MVGRGGLIRGSRGLGSGWIDALTGHLWILDSNGQPYDCEANIGAFFYLPCWTAELGLAQGGTATAPAPLAPGTGGSIFGGGSAAGDASTAGDVPPVKVDCTNFWSALTKSQCSFTDFLGSSNVLPVLVIGGAALVLLLRR